MRQAKYYARIFKSENANFYLILKGRSNWLIQSEPFSDLEDLKKDLLNEAKELFETCGIEVNLPATCKN